MMNYKSVLGKNILDENVDLFLSSKGIDSRDFKIPFGEMTGYVERKKSGVCYVFGDGSFFLGKAKSPLGKHGIYFVGIKFFSEGKDGYSQFKEELPYELSFDLSFDEILKNMGAPEWKRERSDGTFASCRWDIKGVKYHVSFKKETKKPSVISIEIPDQELCA